MYAHTKAPISPRGPVHSPDEETKEGRVDGTHVSDSQGSWWWCSVGVCVCVHVRKDLNSLTEILLVYNIILTASRLVSHFILKPQHSEELGVLFTLN